MNTYTLLDLEDAHDELRRMEELEYAWKELERGNDDTSKEMFRVF